MICPQTKAECRLRTCGMLRWCAKTSRDPSPPPPTLAEIERLVDAYHERILNYERDNCKFYLDKMKAAHTALMSAIQKLLA